MNQKQREALLHLFLQAYEDGNLEIFGAVLEQAEADPELETVIWNAYLSHVSEKGIAPFPEEEKEQLLAFIQQPLPPDSKRPGLPPPTKALVAAHMRVQFILHPQIFPDPHLTQSALDDLAQAHDPLPDPLDLVSIQAIFAQHGLMVPPHFDVLFLQTARLLQTKRSPLD